jgi:uncharacterized glyoxalase superfamily protein PhnB
MMASKRETKEDTMTDTATVQTTTPEGRTAPVLKKLTPNLMVEDIDATLPFYTDVLGFTVVTTVPEQSPLAWAMLQRDDVIVMLQSRESLAAEIPSLRKEPINRSMTFYTEVTDVEGLLASVRDRAEIVQDLHTTFYGAKEFSIRDPNGYIFAFAENVE